MVVVCVCVCVSINSIEFFPRTDFFLLTLLSCSFSVRYLENEQGVELSARRRSILPPTNQTMSIVVVNETRSHGRVCIQMLSTRWRKTYFEYDDDEINNGVCAMYRDKQIALSSVCVYMFIFSGPTLRWSSSLTPMWHLLFPRSFVFLPMFSQTNLLY